jgi:lysophospholipase L1-like esterase
MKDNDNEGWPGAVIDEVHTKAKESAPKFKPNVYLVLVGTNDCVQNRDIPKAGERLHSMIDDLFTASPRATVVLSSLIVNRNSTIDGRVKDVNAQYKKLADELRAAHKRVVFADMHGADGPQVNDLVADGTHPTDAGYKKLAHIFYKALVDASNSHFLQPPEKVDGLPDSGPQ